MNNISSVLIVDDSKGICQTMSMILKRKGFDVDCVMDGPSAIERIKERPFDVVLLDIRLPGMDGVEVFKKIHAVHPKTRVAMMTAYSLEDKVREALDGGAETVFYKPLDIETVISYINKGAQT
jgi:DNA-binding NtrC family response regulator